MSDDRARLQQLLADLSAQLSAATSIDPATRKRLESLLGDTQRTLSGQPPRAGANSLAERLGRATVDFEASHPTLAGTLGSIIDALGQMGI